MQMIRGAAQKLKVIGVHERLQLSVSPTSMRAVRWWALHCRSAIDKGLPFELRVLEGALEAVMQELGAEITELIDVAVPSLDALVTRVIICVLPYWMVC